MIIRLPHGEYIEVREPLDQAALVRAKIRDYDNEFAIFSAPKDYYIAGASKDLPVRNVTP